jgi:Secretion system C-terminal sorting domain
VEGGAALDKKGGGGINADSMTTWVRNINTIGAELWLSKERLANGDGTTSLGVLDNIPNNFTISPEQTLDLQRSRQLTQLLMNDNLDNLSTATLATLATFDEAGGQTEFWAKNILTYYGAHYSPEYVFANTTATPHQEPEGLKEDEREEDISVRVSPNPAKDFVTFRIQTSLENVMSTLELIDINGRVLESYPDIAGEKTITWNTKNLASGIYFYRLQSKSGKMESGKIIVSK